MLSLEWQLYNLREVFHHPLFVVAILLGTSAAFHKQQEPSRF